MLLLTFFNNNTTCPEQRILLPIHSLLLIFFIGLIFSNTTYADKSYIKCWKNAEGQTECGNRVPREYYSQRIRYIDDKGITRKVKDRAKTSEELESEKETQKLLALEAEQKRQSDEYDLVLLKTYLTIDDLLASLNSKLKIIESRSKILKSSIELKKREFGNLVRKAADMERSGKPISDKLAAQLDSSRNELRNMQAQITTEEQNTKKIKETFAHDVERFIIAKSHRIKHSLSTPSQAKKLHAVKLSCLNRAQCDLQWQKANNFIKEFSTRPILYATSQIAVSDIPIGYQDIAMSLSLIDIEKAQNKKLLIFQIRCNREREGREFCHGDEVNDLRKEFKSVVYK